MFAGAAREAVFSVPEVIRRVNDDFVALALSAVLVNGVSPAGDAWEGRLYARLKRTAPAPQGICVLNARGEVLDWALTFEDGESVTAFLDHALARFAEHGGVERPFVTRRWQPFPGGERAPVEGTDEPLAEAVPHPEGEACRARAPEKSSGRRGDLACEIFGRRREGDGYVADTVRQESYIQDHFIIDAAAQRALARAMTEADGEPAVVPEALTRQILRYAYLGHIDVRPIENPRGAPGELREATLRARRVSADGERSRWRISGRTEVSGQMDGPAGHDHTVTLDWQGFVDMEGERVRSLVLIADGRERLLYRAPQRASAEGRDAELAVLPAGRPVDVSGPVRYGVIGRPLERDQVRAGDLGPGAAAPPPAIRAKMMRVHEAIRRARREGRDHADLIGCVLRAQREMDAGSIDRAEAALDEALSRIERE